MKDLTNQEFMEIYSAYLPYNPLFRSVKGKIARVTIYGPYVDKISPFGNNIGKSISMGQLKGSFKLLLRPLPEDTREVTDFLRQKISDEWCDFYDEVVRVISEHGYPDMRQVPYAMLRPLIENHYDLFGLLDRDLALNLNDFEG